MMLLVIDLLMLVSHAQAGLVRREGGYLEPAGYLLLECEISGVLAVTPLQSLSHCSPLQSVLTGCPLLSKTLLHILLGLPHLQPGLPLQAVQPAAEPRVGLLDVTDNCPPVLAYSITESLKQRVTVTLTDNTSPTSPTSPTTTSSSSSGHSLSPGQSPGTWNNTNLHSLVTMTTNSTFGYTGV